MAPINSHCRVLKTFAAAHSRGVRVRLRAPRIAKPCAHLGVTLQPAAAFFWNAPVGFESLASMTSMCSQALQAGLL